MPSSVHFGRKPRAFNPRIAHMSALKYGFAQPAPAIPPAWDNAAGFPAGYDFGVMLNDTLGDCTCAAYYHARQIWTADAAGAAQTEPDSDVLSLYELAAGYDPTATPDPVTGRNPTDQGAQEQTILQYLYNSGAPVGPDGEGVDKIAAYIEVDPGNLDDLRRTIYDCGVAYIGFVVPRSWLAASAPPVWDVVPGDAKSQEGHAVVLTSYDANGFGLISWGARYTMTNAFLATFVDEAYAIADDAWFNNTGKTPLGLTQAQLQACMQGL